jgi:hypothetical protein
MQIRDPIPLNDTIGMFRLPAAFQAQEPADQVEARSARMAIESFQKMSVFP